MSSNGGRREGVVMVIADLGAGGAQQVLSQLANTWAAQGRRVGVITLAGPETDFFTLDPRVERLVAGGVAASASSLGGLFSNTRRVLAVRRLLKAFKGSTAVGFIAPSNILLILASRLLGYRVAISERNDPSRQSFGHAWDSLRRRLYARADIVSANSRSALEMMRAYVPEEKLVWLPNPMRTPPPRAKKNVRREKLILNVGRLHEQKGQDLLIRAFARAAPRMKGWRLCILGEGGERKRLEVLIESLGLSGRAELKGRVDDPFLWYSRASIFAFPSRWEGSPNALIEAMSSSAAAIVCDGVPGVLEIVCDGRDARVVSVEDEAAFADVLVELAGDEVERERLGRQAARTVQVFIPEAAIAAWDAVVWGQP